MYSFPFKENVVTQVKPDFADGNTSECRNNEMRKGSEKAFSLRI